NPARIVLDFPGVQSALQEKKHALSFENAKSAVVVSSDDKTRLIVNLNKMTGYTTLQEGDKVTLRVIGFAAAPARDVGSVAVYDDASSQSYTVRGGRAIQNVDFARSDKGEGLVTLTL